LRTSSVAETSTDRLIGSFLRVPLRKKTNCHLDELIRLTRQRRDVLGLRDATLTMAADAQFGLFLPAAMSAASAARAKLPTIDKAERRRNTRGGT